MHTWRYATITKHSETKAEELNAQFGFEITYFGNEKEKFVLYSHRELNSQAFCIVFSLSFIISRVHLFYQLNLRESKHFLKRKFSSSSLSSSYSHNRISPENAEESTVSWLLFSLRVYLYCALEIFWFGKTMPKP